MLDVTTIAKNSWVSEHTIVRCWVKENVLPEVINVDLNAEFESMGDDSSSSNIHEIVAKLQKLSWIIKRFDPLYEQERD